MVFVCGRTLLRLFAVIENEMTKQPRVNPRFKDLVICGETVFVRINKGWAFIRKMTAEDCRFGKTVCVEEFESDFAKACAKYVNYLY